MHLGLRYLWLNYCKSNEVLCFSWDVLTLSPAAALRWKSFKERSMISSAEVQAITSCPQHAMSTPGHGCTHIAATPQLRYTDTLFLQTPNICVRSSHCSLSSVSYTSSHWSFYLSHATFSIQQWHFSTVTLVICDHTDASCMSSFEVKFFHSFGGFLLCLSMLPNHIISTP